MRGGIGSERVVLFVRSTRDEGGGKVIGSNTLNKAA
jgi:hypothetical protein